MNSTSTDQSVVRMINQIARNFEVQGEDAAAAATAEHVRLFWDPRMKEAIQRCDTGDLSPIARKAVQLLATKSAEAKLPGR